MQSPYAITPALLAVVVLAAVILAFRFVRLYVGAKICGAEVTVPGLVRMKLRGVDPAAVVYALVQAAREGLPLSAADLEVVALAGGNVQRVVNALIIARRANVPLTWETAVALDRAGSDVLGAARGDVVDASGAGQTGQTGAGRADSGRTQRK